MALAKSEINALNVLGARKLSFIPDHFAKMSINKHSNIEDLDNWIYQNLDSRYAIHKFLRIDNNNRIIEVYEIGVEDEKELTMLSLSCPYLDKNI
jgi:hypothetical protein